MTKARLQSEAAEKSNERCDNLGSYRDQGVSPLDFDNGELSKEEADCISYLPKSSRVKNQVSNQISNMYHVQQHLSSRMLSSGYSQPTIIGGSSVSQSFWTVPISGTARSETWESTSVASYNSTIYSDNLGSESNSEVASFGQGISNRNRSFTYPANQIQRLSDLSNTSNVYKELTKISNSSSTHASPRGHAVGVIGAPSSFDAAVGGNRQRAVTLSPNTGSIAENRPLRFDNIVSYDRLQVPNLALPPVTPGASQSLSQGNPSNQRTYSPVLENLGLFSNETLSDVFQTVKASDTLSLGVSPESEIGVRDHDIIKNCSFSLRDSARTENRVPAPPPGFSKTAFSRVGSISSVPECINSRKNCRGQTNDIQYNRSYIDSENIIANQFSSVLDLDDRPDRQRANTFTFGAYQASKKSNLNGFRW